MIRPTSGALAALLAIPALAQPAAIYTNIPSLSNSTVPGTGLVFLSFDRPVRSLDGAFWALLARNTGATTSDAMYLAGSGFTGQLRIQEGVTLIEGVRVAENMSDRRIGITDSGDLGCTIDLTGATTDDRTAVVVTSAGAVSIAFREGQSFTGIAGASWGSSLSDVTFSNSGQFAVRATSIAGVPAANNSALLTASGNNNRAQIALAAFRPTGQIGVENWSAFDFGTFYADATGANWSTRGNLAGAAASNQVLAVNNAVVIQESVTLPGMTSPVSSIITNRMEPNGDWFARGENADDTAWVVRNGVVIADSNDDLPRNPGEAFTNTVWNITNANTFFCHVGSNNGHWLVGGFTNNADPARNGVWLFDGKTVALREGDQVDLDNDGTLDDAYIALTGLTGASLDNKLDGFLTDDLLFYFTADLVNAVGADIGEAYLRVQVYCPSDYNRDGFVDAIDYDIFIALWLASDLASDHNNDGFVDAIDYDLFIGDWLASC